MCNMYNMFIIPFYNLTRKSNFKIKLKLNWSIPRCWWSHCHMLSLSWCVEYENRENKESSVKMCRIQSESRKEQFRTKHWRVKWSWWSPTKPLVIKISENWQVYQQNKWKGKGEYWQADWPSFLRKQLLILSYSFHLL